MKATVYQYGDTGLFDGAVLEFTAEDLEAFAVLKLALANFPQFSAELSATAAQMLDRIEKSERVKRYGKPQKP